MTEAVRARVVGLFLAACVILFGVALLRYQVQTNRKLGQQLGMIMDLNAWRSQNFQPKAPRQAWVCERYLECEGDRNVTRVEVDHQSECKESKPKNIWQGCTKWTSLGAPVYYGSLEFKEKNMPLPPDEGEAIVRLCDPTIPDDCP